MGAAQGSMKIIDIQAIPLAIPLRPMTPDSSWRPIFAKQVLVRVLTDEGLTGMGEAFGYAGPLAVCNVIDESLKPLLIGQDPTRIEHLSQLMQRRTLYHTRRGIGAFAVSGIDIALWDLLGKARNAPLCELLGGAARQQLPMYASMLRYDSPDDVAIVCRGHVARGFRTVKLHQTDVESVRAAREAAGPDVDLVLDANCPWSPSDAIAIARQLEPYRLLWLEEPVWPPEDYDGLAEVRCSTSILIACGEAEATAFGFRSIIERRAVDVLQPSVTKVGGVSEFRKIAGLAATANLKLAPHSPYFGPGLAATLHLMASQVDSMPVELLEGEQELPLLATPIQVREGWAEVPTGPGLGVEIDEDAIRQYPYLSENAQPFVVA
jgi:D-galactarolactone cycloisomerase